MSNPTRASKATAEAYTSRRPLLERVTALTTLSVAGLLAIPLIALAIEMWNYPRPSELGFVPLLLLAILALAAPALVALRPRLRADATGLHVRNILSHHDLPWPTSRTELVVVPAFGLRRVTTSAVQYRPADGGQAVTIHALARSTFSFLEDPSAEQEAEDLWDWGVRHGHIRAGGRSGASGWAATSGGDAGAQSAPTAWSGVGAPGGPVAWGGPDRSGAPAGVGAHLPAGAGARVPAGPAAGPIRLDAPSIRLTAWQASRGPFTLILVILGLILAGAVGTVLHPARPVDAVGAVIALVFFGALTLLVLAAASSTTTIDAEGFHVRQLVRRVDLPWPSSRSDLFIFVTHTGSTSSAGYTCLVLPDGRAQALPGTGVRRGGYGALRAWERNEQIWAWGLAHGVAHDDGAYHPCANPGWERLRANCAAHLAAEHSRVQRASGV